MAARRRAYRAVLAAALLRFARLVEQAARALATGPVNLPTTATPGAEEMLAAALAEGTDAGAPPEHWLRLLHGRAPLGARAGPAGLPSPVPSIVDAQPMNQSPSPSLPALPGPPALTASAARSSVPADPLTRAVPAEASLLVTPAPARAPGVAADAVRINRLPAAPPGVPSTHLAVTAAQHPLPLLRVTAPATRRETGPRSTPHVDEPAPARLATGPAVSCTNPAPAGSTPVSGGDQRMLRVSPVPSRYESPGLPGRPEPLSPVDGPAPAMSTTADTPPMPFPQPTLPALAQWPPIDRREPRTHRTPRVDAPAAARLLVAAPAAPPVEAAPRTEPTPAQGDPGPWPDLPDDSHMWTLVGRIDDWEHLRRLDQEQRGD